MDADIQRMMAQEERVRAQASQRDADRHRGVAWSGLGPEAFRPLPHEARAADAARRLQALQAWRDSRAGRLVRAMSEVQAAAREAYAAAEAIRAAIARDGRAAPMVTQDIQAHARALLAAARTAQTLVDAPPQTTLSGGACATNTASNSPSTGSPTNSAS